MPTLVRRLLDFDRALYSRLTTVEGWTKAMSAWRWALGCACVIAACLTAGLALTAVSRKVSLLNVVPSALALSVVVLSAFRAGQMKVEYERITGKGEGTVMGRRRPTGV